MKAGRRVRWTFEVSADLGDEKRARIKAARPKQRRAKPAETQTAAPDAPVDTPIAIEPATQPEAPPPVPEPIAAAPALEMPLSETPPPVPAPVVVSSVPPPQAVAVRRATHFGPFALIGVMVLVLAALAVPSRRSAQDGSDAAALPEATAPTAQGTDIELVRELVPVTPAMAAAPVLADGPIVLPTKAAMKETAVKTPAPKSERNRIAESPKPVAPVAAAYVTSAGEVPATENSTAKTAAAEPSTAPSTTASSDSAVGTPVTITGCLEISVDEDAFRLTDTEGLDAPKARSWRTGFLTRRSAPIALVDLPDPQTMQAQVGKRVSATGRLVNRELKVSSVRVVRSSCN